MEFSANKSVLLTGAGCSHNFGGYLSSQMWEHIFNFSELQKSRALQQAMIGEWNFERLFTGLQKINGPEFRIFSLAVENAFKDHDYILCHAKEDYNDTILISKLTEWFASFAGKGKDQGFIFTLNQDLFFGANW
jgi:hypothetical protein